jgi:uncharacterized protein (DUF2384 family)
MATLSLPVTPGYAFDSVPDLSTISDRQRLSPSAIKGYFAVLDKWKLDPDAGAALLGGIPRASFYKLKKTPTTLTQDALTRISYVVGIYKALHILLPEEYADAWMMRPNDNILFGGRTPLAYVIHGGFPALERVRSLLDAARGGR